VRADEGKGNWVIRGLWVLKYSKGFGGRKAVKICGDLERNDCKRLEISKLLWLC
jgi:hypothetical protein